MAIKFVNDKMAYAVSDYLIGYFHEYGEPITNLKLQKLLYYAQGWHLAIFKKPLFNATFEAWVHGPVIPDVYKKYKKFKFNPISSNIKPPKLDKKITKHLEGIVEVYGNLSAFQLEHLTHESDPWKIARGEIPIDQASHNEICLNDMAFYFTNKMQQNAKKNH